MGYIRKLFSRFIVIMILALVGVGTVVFLKPELFRIHGIQVPVIVTIRPSVVGVGKVLQVTNTSDKIISSVIISAKNSTADQSASYELASLQPGQVQDLGWMEWQWKLKPGDIITVKANGFLPIVFNTKQLGMR